jgi:glycosyltransferase involved in cell wall biosynthesis
MKLSVIIPTHNRAEILKTCLSKLARQQEADFEVIVVDDGSTDHTEPMVAMLRHDYKMANWTNLFYIKQSASQQGIARNRGVEKATGDIVLFMGDDIFALPLFLKTHLTTHTANPDENVVVLGHTTWDPKLQINPYMRFLESSGWQFAYKKLEKGFIKENPWKYFYTSNISLKKTFFEKEKFDETFKAYGWEDIELGFRLWKKHQMKVYYEPDAGAFHHHQMDASMLKDRMRQIGKSAVIFESLQPESNVVPKGRKLALIKILTNPITLPFSRLLGVRFYYKLKSWREFLKGVNDAKS